MEPRGVHVAPCGVHVAPRGVHVAPREIHATGGPGRRPAGRPAGLQEAREAQGPQSALWVPKVHFCATKSQNLKGPPNGSLALRFLMVLEVPERPKC